MHMPEKNYMYKEFITTSTYIPFTALAKVEKVKNSSPKNCWPTVGQLLADRKPTVGRLSFAILCEIFPPTVGRLLADCRPTVGDLNIYPLLKSMINVRTDQDIVVTFPGSRARVATGCTSFFLDVVR